MVKNNELLGKHRKILDKVSNSIKKGFDNEPAYNEKYLKTNIKSYEGKISTKFHFCWNTKQSFSLYFYIVILIDSAFKIGKNYYSQVLLEECKYIVKEK